MRLHAWTAVALLLLFSQGANCAVNIKHRPTYDELKAKSEPMPYFQMHGIDTQTVERVKQGVRDNFDPRCLSSSKTHVTYETFYCPDGSPVFKKIAAANDTPADDFYCEQAIWEYNPSPGYMSKFGIQYDFNSDPKTRYGANPELLANNRKDFVALHLIPQRFPGSEVALDHDTVRVHESKNVLELSTSRLQDPLLTDFRVEQSNLWKPAPTLSSLRSNADALKAKYASLFSEGNEAGPMKDQLR